MLITDDPIADFERYDAEQEKKLSRLPQCSECGQAIQDEHAFYIHDEFICESCMVQNYRVTVSDYTE